MITYPDRITEQKNGSYTWTCSIEVKYYRKTMGIGFNYKKARTAIFWRQQYIELQGKIAKMRIYIPNEDYDFVKRYIMRRLPGDCEIRYE